MTCGLPLLFLARSPHADIPAKAWFPHSPWPGKSKALWSWTWVVQYWERNRRDLGWGSAFSSLSTSHFLCKGLYFWATSTGVIHLLKVQIPGEDWLHFRSLGYGGFAVRPFFCRWLWGTATDYCSELSCEFCWPSNPCSPEEILAWKLYTSGLSYFYFRKLYRVQHPRFVLLLEAPSTWGNANHMTYESNTALILDNESQN